MRTLTAIILGMLRHYYPHMIAAFIGFTIAATIYKPQIDKAQAQLANYQASLKLAVTEAKERSDKINQEAHDVWIKNLDALHRYYKSQPKRVLQGDYPSCNGLSACPLGTHAAPADAGPGSSGPTAEDCAVTTLQLLQLQEWINTLKGGDPNGSR